MGTMKVTNEKKIESKFGISKNKEEETNDWFKDILIKSEMIDYYNIKGCCIMRPSSFFIWKCIKEYFTKEIEAMGVSEVYFPMMVTADMMKMESEFVENFAPELAWVTKFGDCDLETPLAIRPTSEAIMYPYFSKWINSHRDLPLKVNQWCNVFRWEIKTTVPFIRGKEFLWQEGHTAHLEAKDAKK